LCITFIDEVPQLGAGSRRVIGAKSCGGGVEFGEQAALDALINVESIDEGNQVIKVERAHQRQAVKEPSGNRHHTAEAGGRRRLAKGVITPADDRTVRL